MSRSGYIDDMEDPLAYGRWRQAVNRALQGKRGQAMLTELLEALDSMPEKKLYPGNFSNADGEFCTLGVLGTARGTQMSDLGNADDGCNTEEVGKRFGIARAMAAEIMFMNDDVETHYWADIEICGPVRPYYPEWGRHTRSVHLYDENHPEKRWNLMRSWVSQQIKALEATKT